MVPEELDGEAVIIEETMMLMNKMLMLPSYDCRR